MTRDPMAEWLKPLLSIDTEMARIAELLAGPPLTEQERAEHLALVETKRAVRQGVLPL